MTTKNIHYPRLKEYRHNANCNVLRGLCSICRGWVSICLTHKERTANHVCSCDLPTLESEVPGAGDSHIMAYKEDK